MIYSGEQVRQSGLVRQMDHLRPCCHLMASWMLGNGKPLTFWERSTTNPSHWFVGCEMCVHDANERQSSLCVIVEETRADYQISEVRPPTESRS